MAVREIISKSLPDSFQTGMNFNLIRCTGNFLHSLKPGGLLPIYNWYQRRDRRQFNWNWKCINHAVDGTFKKRLNGRIHDSWSETNGPVHRLVNCPSLIEVKLEGSELIAPNAKCRISKCEIKYYEVLQCAWEINPFYPSRRFWCTGLIFNFNLADSHYFSEQFSYIFRFIDTPDYKSLVANFPKLISVPDITI